MREEGIILGGDVSVKEFENCGFGASPECFWGPEPNYGMRPNWYGVNARDLTKGGERFTILMDIFCLLRRSNYGKRRTS